MKVKSESEVAQSCPTLSNPMDCSLPGSSIHGIFQARVLEWGAIAFSDRMLNKGEFLSGQYLEALVLLPVRDLGCWGRVAAGSLAGEAWGREKAS